MRQQSTSFGVDGRTALKQSWTNKVLQKIYAVRNHKKNAALNVYLVSENRFTLSRNAIAKEKIRSNELERLINSPGSFGPRARDALQQPWIVFWVQLVVNFFESTDKRIFRLRKVT